MRHRGQYYPSQLRFPSASYLNRTKPSTKTQRNGPVCQNCLAMERKHGPAIIQIQESWLRKECDKTSICCIDSQEYPSRQAKAQVVGAWSRRTTRRADRPTWSLRHDFPHEMDGDAVGPNEHVCVPDTRLLVHGRPWRSVRRSGRPPQSPVRRPARS